MTTWFRQGSLRQWSLAGLAFCALMMGVALWLEHGVGLEPCPLCIFQRVAVLAAAAVFLVGILHNPHGRVGLVYAGLSSLAILAGIGIAGRHVWLQSLPADQVPTCGPGLDYMMDVMPLREVLATVFTGSGECAEVDFTFLGLSLPAWTLIGFIVLLLAPLGMMGRTLAKKSKNQP
ncbi:disulfide bond formation protein B [Aidingimonas halophila]|uniref:Disulfide bond formation protein B n=1 Tax=Aidingimonas halophila TaxID=574349 RepID=A0A1H2RWW7_9GAMM|nr:disulfide bond formation protein B [Aidingimonas halophila]GHC18658.1 disulfide bond formation protein B [Aidingimonas halophila]SDW23264.1 Thiol:disulfide interchange protein DsbB [Aidingimonas halophila]